MRKISLLTMLLIVCLSLSSCILPKDILVEDEPATEESLAIWFLSATGDKFIWEEKDDIYAYSDGGYLFKTDIRFTKNTKVNDELIDWPDIQSHRIYYSYSEAQGMKSLMSCNLNGQDRRKEISIKESEYFSGYHISNNNIYYSKSKITFESKNDGLYVFNRDTGKTEKINNDTPYGFMEEDGVIYYYVAEPRNPAIKSYSPETGEVKDATTWDNIIKFFPDNVINDYIYYANYEDNKMYKIRSDGTDKQELFDLKSSDIGLWIIVYEGNGYYQDDSIETIDLETGEKQVLYDDYDECNGINIYRDTVFFDKTQLGYSNRLCRMDLNGGNYKEINVD